MEDAGRFTLAERQSRLVAQVWPDGMPARDQVVLCAVPEDERSRLLDRLEAVWRASRGEPLAPLAKLADLKRAGFYNLRKAWERSSLSGLIPHESRSGRGTVMEIDDPLRARAKTLLIERPLARNVDLAKALMGGEPALFPETASPHDAMSTLQRLERLVREERSRLVLDPQYLKGAYGAGLVLDLTAVSIVLDEEPRALCVVALLMEMASGLVLGSALGRAADGIGLQRMALEGGLTFLSSRKADVVPSQRAAPDLSVVLTDGVDADRFSEALRPCTGVMHVGRVGGYSFGTFAGQIVGQRIGRVPMNPRRTLEIDLDAFLESRRAPVVSMDEARAIWTREIERHNGDRVEALVEAGIVDGASSDGQLAALARRILDTLQSG